MTVLATLFDGVGARLPRIGLGGGPLGNHGVAISDEEAVATVHEAWERGIRYFDTAPHYGLGLAERRLGEALHAGLATEEAAREWLLSDLLGCQAFLSRRDVEVLAGDTGVGDRLPDAGLVAVDVGRVAVAVTDLEGVGDDALRLLGVDLEDAETELGNGGAGVELDGGNGHEPHATRGR